MGLKTKLDSLLYYYMTDKTTILRAFNTHFFDFIDELIVIFPENSDIANSKTSFTFFKKANPTCIIKAWYKYVYVPYKDIIASGDISFFFEKDYQKDLNDLSNPGEIMKVIDSLREPIRNMGDTNQAHSMKYIQNLCKLSDIYSA